MKKAKKWLILLFISLGLAGVGASVFPDVPDATVFPLLALVLGSVGMGYACSQLDELAGPMRFRVHIEISRHPKFSIKRITQNG